MYINIHVMHGILGIIIVPNVCVLVFQESIYFVILSVILMYPSMNLPHLLLFASLYYS